MCRIHMHVLSEHIVTIMCCIHMHLLLSILVVCRIHMHVLWERIVSHVSYTHARAFEHVMTVMCRIHMHVLWEHIMIIVSFKHGGALENLIQTSVSYTYTSTLQTADELHLIEIAVLKRCLCSHN